VVAEIVQCDLEAHDEAAGVALRAALEQSDTSQARVFTLRG
jgi:hypothetical protein